MKKHVLLFCIIFLYLPSLSYAQFEDLAVLESLSENMNKQQSNQPNMPNDENPEEQTQETKMKNIINYTDEEYSYYGKNTFDRTQEEKVSDQPLKHFGYDYFLNTPDTFAQVGNIPIPSEYIIGPGDNIKIILYGKENNEFTLEVGRSGEIFFPNIGPIYIGGLSFSDMKQTIEDIVDAQIIGTKVNLTLGALRNINIFVLGEAFQPGMYTVGALSSLTNSIFISGGLKKGGSLRNIQLKRNGKIITTFDFYEILLNGDITNDVRLMSGDVVFIPSAEKTIGIDGEVYRPGIYEMKEEESLDELISYAGSLKPKARTNAIEILSVNKANNGFDLSQISLNDNLDKHLLSNGDVVRVLSVSNNMNNAVLVRGHFQKPGFYPWVQGQKIGDLITNENILSMTDLKYVLVKRETRSPIQFDYIQVDMEEVITNKDSIENISLEQKDEIILFPSLLISSQIKTKLFQDSFSLDNQNSITEDDEWLSTTFLRKSLMEQETPLSNKDGVIINPITGEETIKEKTNRYYEYSIFDYCVIPLQAAINLIESSGFSANKTIPLNDLQDIKNEIELTALLQSIEKDRVNQINASKLQSNNLELTQICRRQLIDPILSIIDKHGANDKRTISIVGNVQFPGEYPLTENMILNDAIKAGGGSKNATYNSEIELTRSIRSGKKFSVSNSFASVSNTASMKDDLQAMDIVNIKKISTNVKTVEITGEVYFSGTYPISEGQTLTDLINRAGGFTELASIKASVFQRKILRKAELDRLNSARSELRRKIVLSSQTGGLGQTNLDSNAINQLTALLVDDSSDENALGRLVIDLQSIINKNLADIILEDGDTLHIPPLQQTVSVIGEVFVPNSHVYKDKLSINEYIDFSGGVNSFADNQNIYLIKSNGSIIPPSKIVSTGFFRSGSNTLEPGDTIVVPLEIQPFNTIKATTELSQIVYQMAIAAAAVNSFK